MSVIEGREIVTHSHEVAHRASRVLHVADGILVADGQPDRTPTLESAG